MTVKYFCDRCGTEAGEGELRVAELSIPPDPDLSVDLCPSCVQEVKTSFLEARTREVSDWPNE
jgi:hypothetical protein